MQTLKQLSFVEDNQVEKQGESILERWKQARNRAGLSQRDVAKELGVLQPAIGRRETGDIAIFADELVFAAQMARLYDTDLNWVCGVTDSEDRPSARQSTMQGWEKAIGRLSLQRQSELLALAELFHLYDSPEYRRMQFEQEHDSLGGHDATLRLLALLDERNGNGSTGGAVFP